jgi:ABC-type multidrug transport system ATPase subunit
MCGLISPKSGKIELLDEKGLSLNPQSVNISYCSQFPFIDSTSLLENVLQTNESFSQIVLQILEQLGLERFLDNQTWSNQFRKLSGGEKQRIGIARALLNSSHFVVLDEPTSALDSNARNRVHALIKQIRNSTTIVLASHDSALINLSDYVLCLEHGEQVFFGPTSEYYSSKLTK